MLNVKDAVEYLVHISFCIFSVCKCLCKYMLAAFEIISLQFGVNTIYILSCLRLSFALNDTLLI